MVVGGDADDDGGEGGDGRHPRQLLLRGHRGQLDLLRDREKRRQEYRLLKARYIFTSMVARKLQAR